jgi:hypothetical protein
MWWTPSGWETATAPAATAPADYTEVAQFGDTRLLALTLLRHPGEPLQVVMWEGNLGQLCHFFVAERYQVEFFTSLLPSLLRGYGLNYR